MSDLAALHALALRLCAHPRWPADLTPPPDPGAPGWSVERRDDLRWAAVGAYWVPDLEDDATAGVLLGMVPADRRVEELRRSWRVRTGSAWGPTPPTGGSGPTLGAACAEVLLQLWEAA